MPNSKDIADYLESHPDFFVERGELLAAMRLPEAFATPFHERQAQALRDRQARLDRMLDTVKTNQHLEQELHRLAVELLQAAGAADVPDMMRALLPAALVAARFDLSGASIFLDKHQDAFDPAVDYASLCRRVEHLSSVCDDRVSSKLCAALFSAADGAADSADAESAGTESAAVIASCAFVPLAHGDPRKLRGVLVLGDADRARFQPGMGVLILDRLGQLVSAYLDGRGLL